MKVLWGWVLGQKLRLELSLPQGTHAGGFVPWKAASMRQGSVCLTQLRDTRCMKAAPQARRNMAKMQARHEEGCSQQPWRVCEILPTAELCFQADFKAAETARVTLVAMCLFFKQGFPAVF